MILSAVRTQILANVGRNKSGVTTFNADANRAINLAIDLIKLNTTIPALLKDFTSITLASGTQDYTLDSDLDIIVRASIITSTQEGKLTRVNDRNILDKVLTTLDTGAPNFYRLFGSTSAGIPKIRTYPIYAGDPVSASITGEYIPILDDLSDNSDENLITKKYFNSVIKIATELLYRSLIKHNTAPLEQTIIVRNIVKDEANFIMEREDSMADYDPELAPDSALRTRRSLRLTQ